MVVVALALRTTVVGSWWPYEEELPLLRQHHRGELSEQESTEVLNRCAARAIDEQRSLGFTEWTGGEYASDTFVLHLTKHLTGMKMDVAPEENEFDYDDLGHATIVGEIDAPDGLGAANAYRRESALEGGVKKATVVSPMELISPAAD